MEAKEVIISIIKTSCILNDKLSAALKPFEISIQQFNVLRILRGQKGLPANLSTVHEKMVHKMSNTTRLIDKLINKTLVKRNACKQNRRKIELFITPSGLKLLNQIDLIVKITEEKIIEKLNTKEKEEIVSILRHLNN
jgi:DNA-binding MarR family transcriptional regulator